METIAIWGQKQQTLISDFQDGRLHNSDDQPSAANVEWEEVGRLPPGLSFKSGALAQACSIMLVWENTFTPLAWLVGSASL